MEATIEQISAARAKLGEPALPRRVGVTDVERVEDKQDLDALFMDSESRNHLFPSGRFITCVYQAITWNLKL